MEMRLMSISIGICRFIGLCNLRYVPARRRFQLDNGIMLVYWVLLGVVYLVLTPLTFIVMAHTYFVCQFDMLAVAYTVVSLAKSASVLVMLATNWLRRRRIQQLVNGFMWLFDRFPQYHLKYKFWRRHFLKLFLGSARFLVLLYQLFGPGSALMCADDDDEIVTEVPPIYVVLSVATLGLELVLSCNDTLVYFLLASSNRLLECMSQEAQELAQDLRWLPQRYGAHQAVYQRQLFAAWQSLWRSCLRLDALLLQLLHIFQWQMLLNLFTNYLNDITICFNLVTLIADAEYISLWRCIFNFVICFSYHWDILLHFSIFGTNQLEWLRLLARLQKLWSVLKSSNKILTEDSYGVALLRQLEFALVFLNRKLQLRPQRVRPLQITGLFDINRQTWNFMNSSLTINVLILWQIAYKEYY